MKFQSGLGHTGPCWSLHSTFQKQGSTLILCVTYIDTITYLQAAWDGSGNWRRILRIEKNLSEPSMLPQGAQVLIGLLCRNAIFQIRSHCCVFLPTLCFLKCHKFIIYCTSEAVKDLFHTIHLQANVVFERSLFRVVFQVKI